MPSNESLKREQELWRQIGILTKQERELAAQMVLGQDQPVSLQAQANELLEQRCALLRQTRSYQCNRPATKQELRLVGKLA